MKTVGLLGGTSWPSTIEYYRQLNELVAERLGGFHSAKLLLHSIDYHEIKSSYAGGWERIPGLLKAEIEQFVASGAECLIICNNTLHKAFDSIEEELKLTIPVFHAVRLTADAAVEQRYQRVLLLATKFTMEDEFFRNAMESRGVEVFIPSVSERERVQAIQSEVAAGKMQPDYVEYFSQLIARNKWLDAVVLACTELPLVVTQETSILPILNPTDLQCRAAIAWALG